MAASRNNLGGIQKPSSVGDWKKKQEPTLLPSGKSIVLKKTSLAGFLQTGHIPNALMSVIKSAMDDKTGGKVEVGVQELLQDPEGLVDVFQAVDAFMVAVAIEPRVWPVPENDDDRRDDLLYVDEIDDEDKMFVFTTAVGGSGEAQPFRQESAGGVGAVQPRKAVGSATKRPPRSSKS